MLIGIFDIQTRPELECLSTITEKHSYSSKLAAVRKYHIHRFSREAVESFLYRI